MTKKSYQVFIKRKFERKLKKLPSRVQRKLNLLLKDLRDLGPRQPHWPNFSKLEGSKFHCHLEYRWVACWEEIEDNISIEVYYVGSREKAPY